MFECNNHFCALIYVSQVYIFCFNSSSSLGDFSLTILFNLTSSCSVLTPLFFFSREFSIILLNLIRSCCVLSLMFFFSREFSIILFRLCSCSVLSLLFFFSRQFSIILFNLTRNCSVLEWLNSLCKFLLQISPVHVSNFQ